MSNYIVRALDANGDWEFGAGLNNYQQNLNAVALDIQMNLNSYLGNCFFAVSAGIDWFNLLGGKNELAISLAINSTLVNTKGVTGIQQTNFTLNSARHLSISYNVNTVYGTLSNTLSYDIGTIG